MNNDITYYKDASVKISRQDYIKKHSDMLIHDHDFLTISLLLAGSLIEHTSKGTKVVKPGNVLIKPSALMHSDIFTENCSILSFKVYDCEYYNFNCDDWKILPEDGLMKYFLNVVNDSDKKRSLNDLENVLVSVINEEKVIIKIPDKIKHVKTLIDTHFYELC